MKRMTALLCAAVLAAAILASCTGLKDTAEDITKDMATVASEAKDNFDKMVENGTVNDGDGILDEDKYEDDDRTSLETEGYTESPEEVTEYYEKGIFDGVTETADASEYI